RFKRTGIQQFSCSRTFDAAFRSHCELFSDDFTDFYEQYLRRIPETIESRRVPHPWDPMNVRTLPRTEYDASSWVRGIYLDPGLRESKPLQRAVRSADTEERGTTNVQPTPPAPVPPSGSAS